MILITKFQCQTCEKHFKSKSFTTPKIRVQITKKLNDTHLNKDTISKNYSVTAGERIIEQVRLKHLTELFLATKLI